MRPPRVPPVTTLPAPRDMGAEAVDPHSNGTGRRFTDEGHCCGIWPMATSSENKENIPVRKKKKEKESYTVPRRSDTVRTVIRRSLGRINIYVAAKLSLPPFPADRRFGHFSNTSYTSYSPLSSSKFPGRTAPFGNIPYRMKAYFISSSGHFASAHPTLAWGSFPVWQSASAARVERWYNASM